MLRTISRTSRDTASYALCLLNVSNPVHFQLASGLLTLTEIDFGALMILPSVIPSRAAFVSVL